jgi:hypothetical protein
MDPHWFCSGFVSGYGSGLDPYRIRIQAGQWIRIRIRIRNSDPDPGGLKWPTTVEKLRNSMFLRAGCSLLRAEGFFRNLDVLYGGLDIDVVLNKIFFSCKFFQFLVK